MPQRSRKQAVLAVVAVGAALCFWKLNALIAAPALPRPPVPSKLAVRADPAAVSYIQALQGGDWDEVIRNTAWMQDRLTKLQAQAADDAPRTAYAQQQAARIQGELRAQISYYNVEKNQLRPEGVEDQYVFCSGARVEPVGTEGGRADLDRPARSRTWFRVTYPSRARALRDAQGMALQSIVVGVNVSTNGLIMKANVIGNTEINGESASYFAQD
jgi:hypothetical protein